MPPRRVVGRGDDGGAGGPLPRHEQGGPWTWTRYNEILVAEQPHTLAWRTIPTLLYPDGTEWRIDLEPVEDRTRITQSFRLLRAPALLAGLYSITIPTHRGRATELVDDLRRLGELAATDACWSGRHNAPALEQPSAHAEHRDGTADARTPR